MPFNPGWLRTGSWIIIIIIIYIYSYIVIPNIERIVVKNKKKTFFKSTNQGGKAATHFFGSDFMVSQNRGHRGWDLSYP
jgi:hypothetical protein